MIDIKTLKQYPLSFRLLEQWVEQKHTTSLALLLDKVTNEELIEFLDENDIFIEIVISRTNGSINEFQHNGFKYHVYGNRGFSFSIKPTERQKAIANSIIEGFKLLEQKLKVN